MDIQIFCDVNKFKKLIRSNRLSVIEKNGYCSAVSSSPHGRYHILFIADGKQTFCELHFDNTIHFLFIGVDYTKKPLTFFRKYFQPILKKEKIHYVIENNTWRNRRNKAVFTRFKI